MKYFLYRTAAFVCILILCTLVPGIALNQIFILEEFLLVICGVVLFSLIPVLQEIKKGNRVLFPYAVSLIAKNAFVSGVFISLIFILSDINTAALLGDEDGVVTSLIMLENMRPFCMGHFSGSFCILKRVILIIVLSQKNRNLCLHPYYHAGKRK